MSLKIKCPWCRRRDISPTKTGKLWKHKPNTRESSGEFLDWCAGSGRLPKEWDDLRKLRMTFVAAPESGLFNPGSYRAVMENCTCSTIDNNHGRWAPCPPDGWLVALDCTLHRKRNA